MCFYILILLFVFIMFNKLVKYDFILRYEACVNAIGASIFIENVPQIRAKTYRFPVKFAREASMKSAILYQLFFSETDLENSCKIIIFSRKFAPENPAKFDTFFRDQPEALLN